MMRPQMPALVLVLTFAVGCGEPPKPMNAGGMTPESAAPAPARTVNGELVFTLPAGWIEQPPSSSMRWKQFSIPVKGGDAIEVSAFSSRTIGGTVRQNLDRWVNQIVQSDGSSSKSVALETVKQVGDLTMTTVEVPGMFQNSPMMGGSGETISTARLIGTVVETPYGNYFFKLVGENDAVLALKGDYEAFLDSMKP